MLAPNQQFDLSVRHELWRRGVLSWKFHAGQQVVYDSIKKLPSNVKEALALIARRWGKSYAGCAMAIEDCLRTPGATVAIIAPTIKQAANIVAPLIREIIKDAPKGLIRQSKSQYKYVFANGSELILGGFDTAVESFRGLKLYNIYLEESGQAAQDDYEYILSSVLLPTLLHTHGRIIHLTTLSRVPNHPLHTVTIPKTKLAGSFFSYDIYANPLLTKEDIEEFCQAMGGPESPAWKRECLNILSRDETVLCIPEWDASKYVRELPLPERYNIWVGGDLGGTRDKSVLHIISYDFVNDCILFLDELAFDNSTSTKAITAAAKAKEANYQRPMLRRIDASGQTLTDLMQTYEYPAMLPDKTSLDASVNVIRHHLTQGKVLISPKCKLLIATLESQTFNKQRTDLERTNELGHGDALMSAVYGIRHAVKTNPYPANYKQPRSTHYTEDPYPNNSHPLVRAFRP